MSSSLPQAASRAWTAPLSSSGSGLHPAGTITPGRSREVAASTALAAATSRSADAYSTRSAARASTSPRPAAAWTSRMSAKARETRPSAPIARTKRRSDCAITRQSAETPAASGEASGPLGSAPPRIFRAARELGRMKQPVSRIVSGVAGAARTARWSSSAISRSTFAESAAISAGFA